jgi:hypothetical protein
MIHAYLPAEDSQTVYGAISPDLRLTVRRYRSTARWGYTLAQIDVDGPEHAVWSVLEMLRRPVLLVNDLGVEVWAGFVYEAEVQSGALRVGASLENMANRVSVAYTLRTPTGYERRTSAPLDDTASQYRYGIKEALITIGEATAERAAAKAADVLASSANPPKLPSFGGASSKADGRLTGTLHCVGWSNILKWRKYQRSGARVANEGQAGKTQAIGWQLTSSDVVFSRKTGLVDFFARFKHLDVGVVLAVSGSTSNNRTFTVTQTQSGERVTYTANTIFFDPSDDIYDNAQGFGFIEVWKTIRISGSAQNNGIYEVDGKQNDGYFTVTGSSIVSEAAGPTITIEQGADLMVSPAPTYEYSASTKTVVLYGHRMAQSFVATDTLPMREISIMAAVIGTPSDTLRVALHANNAGQPGAQLAQSTLAAAALPNEEPAWTTFTFSPLVNLTSGTTYWIVVERTGSLSATDYYSIKTTPSASGTCLAWNGSAWIANPTGEFVPHIVQCVQETTAQIAAIVTASGGLASVRIEDASGIFDSPDRDGDLSCFDEIDKLLSVGRSDGRKLQAAIDSNRNMRVYAAPVEPQESDAKIYTLSGRIVTATGSQPDAEGVLPAGEWIAIERVPRHLAISPLYVDEAEYAPDSQTYTITPEQQA